jgi:hypothetical protein
MSLLVCVLSSSCATLLNSPTTRIKVYSVTDSLAVRVKGDTAAWSYTPTAFEVPRSKHRLILITRNDSVEQEIAVSRKTSYAAIGTLLVFWPALIVDVSSPKVYSYPSVVLNPGGQPPYYLYSWIGKPRVPKFQRYGLLADSRPLILHPPKKHQVSFNFGLPLFNEARLNTGDKYENMSNTLGIVGGVEYYLTDKYRLRADAGVAIYTGLTMLEEFPYPSDTYTDDFAYAWYTSLQVGSRYKRFSYDAGVQYTRTSFRRNTHDGSHYREEGYVLYSTRRVKQNTAGLAFTARYRVSNTFYVGLNYHPSFFVFDRAHFHTHYSHTLFASLLWNIRLTKY